MHHTNRVRPFIIADGRQAGRCQRWWASRAGLRVFLAQVWADGQRSAQEELNL